MEKVTINRKIYGKNSLKNVIDTNFNDLIKPKDDTETSEFTVNDFFDKYNTLFYSIPASGSNSHQELVNRSSEYLDISFQELIEEIRQLRQDNVSLRNQLITISNRD